GARHARRALCGRRHLRSVRRRAADRERARAPRPRRIRGAGSVTPPSNAAQGAVARPARRRRTEEVLRAFHEEAEPVRTHDIGLLVKLWAFLRPYRRLLLGTLLVILLTSAAALARPLIMLRAIDEGVLQGDADVLTWGGIVLVAVVALEQLLTFVQIYATQVVGARAMADLRRATFRFLHGLRLGYFDRQPIGRPVTRVPHA